MLSRYSFCCSLPLSRFVSFRSVVSSQHLWNSASLAPSHLLSLCCTHSLTHSLTHCNILLSAVWQQLNTTLCLTSRYSAYAARVAVFSRESGFTAFFIFLRKKKRERTTERKSFPCPYGNTSIFLAPRTFPRFWTRRLLHSQLFHTFFPLLPRASCSAKDLNTH